jgi:hypothetical protein
MKTASIYIAAMLFTISVTARATQRIVLGEFFTNTS